MERDMRKIGFVLAALICCLNISACQNDEKSTAQAQRTEMVYASTKDIRIINPHLYSGEMAAQSMVFEPLVVNTPEGVKPCLAESWEISADGLEYTFHCDKVAFLYQGEIVEEIESGELARVNNHMPEICWHRLFRLRFK